MFGYVTVNEPELKIKDFHTYRSFYCGVCQHLRNYGLGSWVTLNYDMAFVALLLSSLYDDEGKSCHCRCLLHPLRKGKQTTNRYTEYAADMTILLTYYQCRDHWLDERLLWAKGEMVLLSGTVKRLCEQYPRQYQAIDDYVKSLYAAEKRKEENIDTVAGLTGRMLAEIFVIQEDEWSDQLRQLGFYLGKFIYLMDAVEDLEKDIQKGNYNPLQFKDREKDFDQYCENILTAMLSEAARVFERLPILQNADILRNILYSGVWSRYEMKLAKRRKEDSLGSV